MNCKYRNNYNVNMLEKSCNDIPNLYEYVYEKDECACGFEEEFKVFPENPMYGQSYVPIQVLNEVFTPRAGLRHGTLFPELVSPYRPNQDMEEIAFVAAMNTVKEGCNK